MTRQTQLWLILLASVVISLIPLRLVYAQTWQFDVASSTVGLRSHLFADDLDPADGGPASELLVHDTFTPGLMSSFGMVDWGAEASSSATDGSVTSASGANFVTIDGDGTDTLIIRWQAVAITSSATGTANFGARTYSEASAMVKAEFLMPPGSQYRRLQEFRRDVFAESTHEEGFEDSVRVTDSLVVTLIFPTSSTSLGITAGGTIGADADPRPISPFYLPHSYEVGHGSNIINSPIGKPFTLIVRVDGLAIADLKPPGTSPPNPEISSGIARGEFRIRMVLVPEPTTGISVLLFTCAGTLIHRRRRENGDSARRSASDHRY